MEQQLEQLVTCAVCLDRIKQPKILPCQHSFCMKPCLQKLVVDKSVRCPQCRSVHKLPQTGLIGLPNNLTLVAILELPSARLSKTEESCQECLKENCKPDKCSHCDKKLCTSCVSVHSQQLLQALSRSINQVRHLLPKMSETITELEQQSLKSRSVGDSVKAEVDQAIVRCIGELQNRQQALHEQIDSFVTNETRQLRLEQENIEMELALMSSHCESAEQKSNSFIASDSVAMTSMATEAHRLTQQCKEHLRNAKLITTNVEDRVSRKLKFHGEGEQSLLTTVSNFGEIGVTVPSRMSFTLGSDPEINDAEILRAMHVNHGRRQTDPLESSTHYVPSFALASIEAHSTALASIEANSTIHSNSTSLSEETTSPHGSSGSISNSPRILNYFPTPGLSLPPPRVGRPRRNARRSDPSSNRGGSFFTLGPESLTSSAADVSLSLQEGGLRGALRIYRSKGPVKRWFGTKGSDVACMHWPRGIAVSPNDLIVAADSSNHRVHIFDASGEPTLTFGSYGTDEGQFDCLAGVHVTAQGWVITTDRYNHRVQIFDSMGRFIRLFGQEGTGEGDLSYPWGVATDNMGFVYVCDKDNHRIQVFTLDGQFIRKFGRLGTYDGQFDGPHYLAVTNNNKVIVSDSGNHRIQVFDKYGRFLFKFGREGSADGLLKYPRGVAIDRHGNIIIGDSGNNRVQVFTRDGTYVAGFGSWGPAPGQMKGIEGIALLGNNDIVISDRENHRIQVF